MAGELHELGFRNVTELPHGEPTEIASGVRVGSYQYGFDDTVFVVQAGEYTLVDVNDCKIRGRAPSRSPTSSVSRRSSSRPTPGPSPIPSSTRPTIQPTSAS